MQNYVTGYQYTGINASILADAGCNKVLTFKQATRDLKIAGKKLKGIKAVARLVRFSKTEMQEDENGKLSPKPIYFSVFDAEQVLARAN